MFKKKLFWGILVALMAIGVVFYLVGAKMSPTLSEQNGQRPKEATVFFHGYGSSRNAEKSMSQYLVDHDYSNRRINVTVAKDGTVTMDKTIAPGDKNPIILVQFDNNKNQDFNQTAKWVTTIMTKLSQQGIRSVNLIGHSMGNMAIAFYLMNAADNGHDLPKVVRQISIAGTYNGLILANPQSNSPLSAEGEPQTKTEIFNRLAGLTAYYQNHSTKVLNIYGNSTGGSDSDTTVYNNSSKALKYFVRQPSTYQETLIEGAGGQHSKLHENQTVNQDILKFLQN
ncbi:Uncharacterized conserved protein with an alpha/beta hydrolase fold [Fructobacillus tropaeoli]|uniref:alpha/beta hydrolase n=1 Tax=Fructobacillus tropaeoli TaxID=709323 RepID=UPI002D946513|nr:Uncharacterized conserved protein with an alpha/beta hydrolase fold [Fructobacillus tropaeoli]